MGDGCLSSQLLPGTVMERTHHRGAQSGNETIHTHMQYHCGNGWTIMPHLLEWMLLKFALPLKLKLGEVAESPVGLRGVIHDIAGWALLEP